MDGVGGPDVDPDAAPGRRQGHVDTAEKGQGRGDHRGRQPVVRCDQAEDDAGGHAERQK